MTGGQDIDRDGVGQAVGRLASLSTTSRLAWALGYAGGGIAVFPLRSNKSPLTAHGFHDAITDEAQIRAWWAKWEYADIGGVPPHGVIVLDLDEKHGVHGIADFVRFDGRHPDDVGTLQATTPSGGRHLFFAADGQAFKHGRIPGTGIDVIVHNKGYVALPHPDGGRAFVRIAPLAPAPAWLLAAREGAPRLMPASRPGPDLPLLIGKAKSFTGVTSNRARLALDRACEALSTAPPGQRDYLIGRHVYWLGRMAGAGEIDSDATRAALVAAMRACSEPDARKTETNVAKVARCFNDGMARPAIPDLIERFLRLRGLQRRRARYA